MVGDSVRKYYIKVWDIHSKLIIIGEAVERVLSVEGSVGVMGLQIPVQHQLINGCWKDHTKNTRTIPYKAISSRVQLWKKPQSKDGDDDISGLDFWDILTEIWAFQEAIFHTVESTQKLDGSIPYKAVSLRLQLRKKPQSNDGDDDVSGLDFGELLTEIWAFKKAIYRF